MIKSKIGFTVFLLTFCILLEGIAFAGVLKEGARGDDVRKVQELLLSQGYLSGTVDGIYGKATAEAVRRFQKAEGLKADGICGQMTMERLQKSAKPAAGIAAVKKGMRGAAVVKVQKLLIRKGCLAGTADGVCGAMTDAAIRKFQRGAGLTVDGVCGPMTMEALENPDVTVEPQEAEENTASGRGVFVEATAYSAQDPGLNAYTASGTRVRHGVVAVDPSFIPLGTRIFIPGYGEAVAEDIGWGIKGNRIDVAFDTHYEAMSFGRRSLEIYIMD